MPLGTPEIATILSALDGSISLKKKHICRRAKAGYWILHRKRANLAQFRFLERQPASWRTRSKTVAQPQRLSCRAV